MQCVTVCLWFVCGVVRGWLGFDTGGCVCHGVRTAFGCMSSSERGLVVSDRVTVRDLEAWCRMVNVCVNGDPLDSVWFRDRDDRLLARVGAFYIDGAYGGYALYRVVTDGGGVRDVFDVGHVPKRELYGMLRAFLAGIELGAES